MNAICERFRSESQLKLPSSAEITAEVFKPTAPANGYVALYKTSSTSKSVTGRAYRNMNDVGKFSCASDYFVESENPAFCPLRKKDHLMFEMSFLISVISVKRPNFTLQRERN